MRTLPTKRTHAFSLIEVLIGSCIILFILIPALVVVGHAGKAVGSARMTTLASSELQSLVEDFRAMNYSDIKDNYLTGKSQPVSLTPLITPENFTGAHATRFLASGRFQEVSGKTGLMEAWFNISWVDPFGHIQSRTYYTRFSANGLSDQVLKGF